jgi:hypothetical protein
MLCCVTQRTHLLSQDGAQQADADAGGQRLTRVAKAHLWMREINSPNQITNQATNQSINQQPRLINHNQSRKKKHTSAAGVAQMKKQRKRYPGIHNRAMVGTYYPVITNIPAAAPQ